MVGEIAYMVIETCSDDSTVMSVHASRETAEAKRDRLANLYPQCSYWVDALKIKE